MDSAVEEVTKGVGAMSTNEKVNSNPDLVAATSGNKKPPTAVKKSVKKSSAEDLTAEEQPTAVELDYVGIVLNLRKEIQHLKGDLNEYKNTIDDIKQREKQVSALVTSIKQREEASLVDASPRVLLDRQKKQYQILIAKLRREVRRLKYQRNSLADPLLEVKYYPNLPRTSTSSAARKSTSGLVGSAQDKLSDFFALNPPPQTGIRRRVDDVIMKVQYTSGWDSGYNGGTPAQSRPMSASSQRYMKKLTTLQSSSASSANQDGEVDDSGKETNAIVRVTSSPSPSMPFKIGERVYAAVQGSMCLGTVRYIGSLVTDNKNYSNNKKQQLATGDHISGLLWVGVRLERPIGYHDGIFKGKRFFQTEPNHGVFVRVDRVIPFISSADDIALIEKEAMYSRQHGHHSYSTSSSSSDVEVTDDNVVNQLIKQVHRLENSAGI